MENKKYDKNLSDVFKELEEVRRKQAIENNKQFVKKVPQNKKQVTKKNKSIKKENKVRQQNENINFDIYQNYNLTQVVNHKFSAMGIVIGILFFAFSMVSLQNNYIFATSEEEEKTVIGTYEQNENPIDLMACISENISEIEKKEITTEKIIVEREIEYIENNQLPKDEQIIIEEGKDGYRDVTYIRSYEGEELAGEVIISDILVEDSSKAVIQVGTSKFLSDNKAHIGDIMYTLEEIPLMSEPMGSATKICNIYQYIDLTLKEVKNNWCKIVVDGIEGYVEGNLLTSAQIHPDMPEKSRIKRIMLTLNFDMAINKPSGLTRADFVKVLSNNEQDVNEIFQNNAGLFYHIEQQYNVNGIFLAAIGIHESNWGNSRIANDKKNLFGYGAYDSSPYTSSVTFESYEYGIELLAKVLSKYYINEPGTAIYDGETAVGSYYNGPTVSGVNVRYASDSSWCNRVYAIMEGLYEKLGK